jgi:hypothetical protein
MIFARVRLVVLLAVVLVPVSSAAAQELPAEQTDQAEKAEKADKAPKRGDVLADTPDTATQVAQLRHAIVRLPIAAALASVLALRPRRRGTPPRQAPVIQTQIILAIVGAVVMLVVGSSLARAFGIVGAAGLVRYRARIEDPKDAGVMLSTLAVGLASGIGVWMLASFATVFILLVLWVVESFEPKARLLFTLKVKAKNPAILKPKVEQVLARNRVKFELRGTSKEELHYEVRIPLDRKADRLTDVIMAIDPDNATAAELEEKKDKK